ncbi:prepilin peptidase [Ochrobactrum sp. RH2CCR150]|uniref:A24 family peptidase n=1 Tax=Ochrobactrum sp. RH2CCR150 TaxID=2587044 RepID=UPI0015FCFC8D|nr:prepilin peptidase CpaA [Ochrobactrum sp. RH2CCR150]
MVIAALMTAIFVAAMVSAMITDLLSMTIRNRVSIGLAAGFLILAPFSGLSLADYGWHVLAGVLMLGITFLLFCLRTMGGGDAKMIAATTLWFGFNPGLADYVLKFSILGGVLTLLIILYRLMPRPVYADRYVFLERLSRKDVGIPYGIALGAAGLWSYPLSPVGQSIQSILFAPA